MPQKQPLTAKVAGSPRTRAVGGLTLAQIQAISAILVIPAPRSKKSWKKVFDQLLKDSPEKLLLALVQYKKDVPVAQAFRLKSAILQVSLLIELHTAKALVPGRESPDLLAASPGPVAP